MPDHAGEPPVIEARQVSKRYGSTVALDRLDLRVPAGTVHGLLGPNGAGKTTFLSSLFGLVEPDHGVLRLFGRTRAEAAERWLDGVGGFVEAPRFYPYLTARQNLELLARLDGLGVTSSVSAILSEVGLDGQQDRKIRGYSLGMRQRLGLAAALLRRPRLLVLDEPTNGMDPAGVRDLRSTLRRFGREGITVLVSSHDMHGVEETCDSVTVLHRGRNLFTGSLDTLRDEAPDPAWRLHTSDDDTALAYLRGLPPVKVSVHDEGGLSLHAGQAQLDQAVLGLGAAGVAVRGLTLDTTPLEALYFNLTERPAGGRVAPVRSLRVGGDESDESDGPSEGPRRRVSVRVAGDPE
jgi:ABC-2 type transport system ATP-binding protein